MKRRVFASCASLALAFTSWGSPAAQDAPTYTVTPLKQIPSGNAERTRGPALWKVADEDTTIYLFGTIHILPANVKWYGGDIARALETSDQLVTEILPGSMEGPEMQAMVMQKARLPQGQYLREMLTSKDRRTYERALARLGAPKNGFDPYEPWFAGLALSILPLVQAGYDPEKGVEEVLEAVAPAHIERTGLETPEEQLAMLDTLPRASQIAMLIASAKDPARMIARVDDMVYQWQNGDAAALGESMNEELGEPGLAEAILFERNERWAEWIDARLAEPGAVFLAVGAGHLAGEKSVQDYLQQRDIMVTRIQ